MNVSPSSGEILGRGWEVMAKVKPPGDRSGSRQGGPSEEMPFPLPGPSRAEQ